MQPSPTVVVAMSVIRAAQFTMPCLQAAFLLHCHRAVPQPQGKRQYSPTPQMLAVPQDSSATGQGQRADEVRCQQRPVEAIEVRSCSPVQPSCSPVHPSCSPLQPSCSPLDSLEQPVPGSSIHLGGACTLETENHNQTLLHSFSGAHEPVPHTGRPPEPGVQADCELAALLQRASFWIGLSSTCGSSICLRLPAACVCRI